MKLIPSLVFVVGLTSCSGKKESPLDSTKYILIRDNLYSDKSGNLYLKAFDRSLAEGGTAEENEKFLLDRWLNVVYCDTCKLMFTNENPKQLANKPPDRMTELRNVVDTATFRFGEIASTENVTIYQDKNYRYYHHVMLDGGTISLGERRNKTEKNVEKNKLNDSIYFTPIYFKKLQKYIRKNGKTEQVNISSRSDKPIYIMYHILEIGDLKLTVDNGNRIYFNSKNPLKLGNILLSEDSKHLSFEDCDEKNKNLIWSTYVEALKMVK